MGITSGGGLSLSVLRISTTLSPRAATSSSPKEVTTRSAMANPPRAKVK
jgi:hypothetical protein